MRIPSVKVLLESNNFVSGLLATVFGILLTFGTSYLIECHTDSVHKKQLLISMVIYLDNQEQILTKDSIEAVQIDSILGPILKNYTQTGEMPDRDEMNDDLLPLLGVFRNHYRDDYNRQYFEGNSEVMQLMDIHTIYRFNNITSNVNFLENIYKQREKAREELCNWAAAQTFSGKMAQEGYWKVAEEELMTHPALSVFYKDNLVYRGVVSWMLPLLRATRQAIINVNNLDEADFVQFYADDPYNQELKRLLGGQYGEKNDIGGIN